MDAHAESDRADCPLVLVEWEDSTQPVPAWVYAEGFDPGGVVRCASVGWLLYDGEDLKAVAPNMGGLDSKCSAQVSGVIRIPTRCVVRIIPLGELTSCADPESHLATRRSQQACEPVAA
jgi:hypothetical protein